jgi:hypothetical protein
MGFSAKQVQALRRQPLSARDIAPRAPGPLRARTLRSLEIAAEVQKLEDAKRPFALQAFPESGRPSLFIIANFKAPFLMYLLYSY